MCDVKYYSLFVIKWFNWKKNLLIINNGLLFVFVKEGNGNLFILYNYGNIFYIFLEIRYGLVIF